MGQVTGRFCTQVQFWDHVVEFSGLRTRSGVRISPPGVLCSSRPSPRLFSSNSSHPLQPTQIIELVLTLCNSSIDRLSLPASSLLLRLSSTPRYPLNLSSAFYLPALSLLFLKYMFPLYISSELSLFSLVFATPCHPFALAFLRLSPLRVVFHSPCLFASSLLSFLR